jgi:hypothetical protein
MRVAVLDTDGRLVGARNGVPEPGDIDAGDLPADGRYRWEGKSFVPVAAGPALRVAMLRARVTAIFIERALRNGAA